MIARLVTRSFLRAKRRKVLAIASVTIGVGVASGLVGLTTRMGDIVAEDLRRYGANILVRPKSREIPIRFGGVMLSAGSRRLRESDLPRIKDNFWRHNILNFAPYIYAAVREPGSGREIVLVGTWFDRPAGGGADLVTGVRKAAPWWKVEGEWVPDEGEGGLVMIGARLASDLGIRIGESIALERGARGASFRVIGIVRTGGDEEDRAFTRMAEVQELLEEPGAVAQVMVSALTRPEPRERPVEERMTPEEKERFFCTPYPSNIARTIETAIPGSRAEPIAAVTRVERDLLLKVEAVSIGMGAVAIVGAVLGVLAAMAQAIGARRGEMALMQVLGARRAQVFGQFAVEGAILGLIGGTLGFLLGVALMGLGSILFGIPVGVPIAVLPLVLLISIGVVLAGTLPHALRALRAWPVRTLKVEGI